MTAVPDDQLPEAAPAPIGEDESGASDAEATPSAASTLSQAARRERLDALARALGDGSGAVVEGDKLIQEAGQGVAIHGRVDPDGSYGLVWWMTSFSSTGHPRWRQAASFLTQPGEAIYTSALGGGFLVEVERRAAGEGEAVQLAQSQEPVERVLWLIEHFPDELAKLTPEPVPSYLLPPDEQEADESEAPPQAETEATDEPEE